MYDLSTLPDYGLGWLDASGLHADIVLSTRVRVARNLQGHAFGSRDRLNDRLTVLKDVTEAAGQTTPLASAPVLDLCEMDPRTRELLLERRLVSRELIGENGSSPAREAPSSSPPSSR